MPDTSPAVQSLTHGAMPTLFVHDLDRSVDFYTTILGLRLAYRAGNHFATIDAGDGQAIGLHPPSRSAPPPGTVGSIQIGLNVSVPIESAVDTLQQRGVQFEEHGNGPIQDDDPVKLAFFRDPDGHVLYLCQNAG